MLSQERQAFILENIKKFGSVKLSQIVNQLDTSESTIRRDLDLLEKKNLIKRVHGGAVAAESIDFAKDYSIVERSSLYLEDKIKIAKYASSIIKDGEFIYLDSGTTTYEMIPFLKNRDIIVVTNGIYNAERLMENDIKSYLIGGNMKKVTKTIVGEMAVSYLGKFNFNKAFIGVNGIEKNSALTTPDISEAVIKSRAIEISEKSYVLADKSKFGKISFARFAGFEEVSIITNADKKTLDENTDKNSKIIQI